MHENSITSLSFLFDPSKPFIFFTEKSSNQNGFLRIFFLVKKMVMLGLSENLRGDTITLMIWTKGMSK